MGELCGVFILNVVIMSVYVFNWLIDGKICWYNYCNSEKKVKRCEVVKIKIVFGFDFVLRYYW